MKYGFGIDLGGTTVKIAYFDAEGHMLDKWEIPTVTENGGSRILPDIADSVKQYMADRKIDPAEVLGAGIGVPGPVNSRGVVNRCVNLGWGVFNISETLSSLIGMPVKAGNDANVAAMGEYWMGGGQGCDNMVMATLGTGVGGGIVVEGRLLHGAHGAGGEIGHVLVNPEETEVCGCGNYGCAEQYCSATGIVRLANRYLASNDTPSAMRGKAPLTCKDIFDLAKDGDVGAVIVREQYFECLGAFLARVCCVADPEVVVLGGGVSKAGKVLIKGMEPYFRKYAFHACHTTRFALAVLGNDAGAYGAFKLALDAFGE